MHLFDIRGRMAGSRCSKKIMFEPFKHSPSQNVYVGTQALRTKNSSWDLTGFPNDGNDSNIGSTLL